MRLSVDAGGTYFRYIISYEDKVIAQGCESSINTDLGQWLDSFLAQKPDLKTVGIGYAGQVCGGNILAAPNMTLTISNIKEYLESRYDVSVFIQNDLECAVIAEARTLGCEDICALYLGSGMGLGVMSHGRLLQGSKGVAAELGHIPYKKSPFVCGCGKDNCIELFASGSGLGRFKKHLSVDEDKSLEQLRHSEKRKEYELYELFEDALMHALGTVITLFNPKIVVLGGGIFTSDKVLFTRVLERYKEFTMPQSAKDVKIVQTRLENAVLTGASMLKEKI